MFFKKTAYNPLYFLASLWAGGLVVTFFMYLMFITKHNPLIHPIPTYNTLMLYFEPLMNMSGWVYMQAMIVFAVFWMFIFWYLHIKLLIWNLISYIKFRKTRDFKKLKESNAEVTLMAIPLTLAMTVNVLFMFWAIFIPDLWDYVEKLFPISIVLFLSIWIYALKIFWEYFTRILSNKSFDFVDNNSLSQMLSVFAFAMVWVWLAAPAAMSSDKTTIAIAMVWTIFFITIAIFFAAIKIILGFKSMMKYWIKREASPTLWIVIPFLTVVWISLVRQKHGLHTGFDMHSETGSYFTLTTMILSIQLIFGFIGYKVMKANGYFKDFIYGKEKSPWSYALICPWVALVVSWFFFLHLGFVKTWIVEKFSITYFVLLAPIVYLQLKTIYILYKLNKKML